MNRNLSQSASLRVDLHTHTTASDGALSPAELYALQREAGNDLFAITDHDTLDGYDSLAASLADDGPRLVPGIEFSTVWRKREIHIVGLGFDPADDSIRALVAAQYHRRIDRARRIGERFDYLGIKGAYEGAMALADGGIPGRPHFARFLINGGRVGDMDTAFRRYLADGKPAACRTDWPGVEEVAGCVKQGGGVAVLAHPAAYELTRTKLRELLADFSAAGGGAIEVAVPGVNPDQQAHFARLGCEFGLKGSAGSDFHDPGQFWRHPGRVPALPEGIDPVWQYWV